MAGHTSWRRLRDEALADPAVRAGYDRADRAIRFGDTVRRAREALGISQEELARRMGTKQPHIARLELGGVDPKLSTIERVNRALGTELVIQFVPPPGEPSAATADSIGPEERADTPPRARITVGSSGTRDTVRRAVPRQRNGETEGSIPAKEGRTHG